MHREENFDFDTPIDRLGTSSEKWAMYEERGILPLWLADMDFRSPPAVMHALRKRIDHGIFGYTRVPEELDRTVIEMLEAKYAWQVEREWLVWLPGLVTGLNVACRAFGDDGDHILTTVPVYPPFLSAPANNRRNLITVPLAHTSGKWKFDLDRIQDAITSKTRLFLLCSPYNPVGRVFDRRELTDIVDICKKHDVIICSDEIHCGLILDRDKQHIPTAALSPEAAERTVALFAPSKTFNLPGLGCSFAVIADPDLRRDFKKSMAGLIPSVNLLGYTAALEAYRAGEPWLARLLDYLRINRELVMESVDRMRGLSMSRVEATYLAWIDTREADLGDPTLFFEKASVGLGNGRIFGGSGFVRLTFGCPRSILTDALERMERALANR